MGLTTSHSQRSVMPPLQHSILSMEPIAQSSSPLFRRIPPEIRSIIFSLAVSDYPDTSPSRQYSASTIYSRPAYFAPRRSDTQLLRTCRAVYAECWFMPFLRREQTHWLGRPSRAPPEYNQPLAPEQLKRNLERIQAALGEGQRAEIDKMHIFAQMFRVEDGTLADFVGTAHLHPKQLNVTIRHTDWWYWETDEPLCMKGTWLKRFGESLSSSTREVVLELETTKRRKGQLQKVVKHMTDTWFIKRGAQAGGDVLYADAASVGVSSWTGRSNWQGQRWVRDEVEPYKIEYCVMTVPFRSAMNLERRGAVISDMAMALSRRNFDDIADRLECGDPDAEPSLEMGWEPDVDTQNGIHHLLEGAPFALPD